MLEEDVKAFYSLFHSAQGVSLVEKDWRILPAGGPSTVSVVACESYESDLVRLKMHQCIECLGGLGRFVAPGDKVLIKPNLLGPFAPAECVTTHPTIVAAAVELCLAQGASSVWVGDSPAGNYSAEELWETTGLAEVIAGSRGVLKRFDDAIESLPCGEGFLPIPRWLQEVDKIISLPKLKTHLLTTLSCAMKNVYGLVVGQSKALYHRKYPSPRKMSAFLVDVYEALRPTLTIVDAVYAMEGNGPSMGRSVPVGAIIAGEDAVAVDSVVSPLFGLRPEKVPMIRMALERGLGEAILDRIRTPGDGLPELRNKRLRLPHGRFLQWVPERLFQPLSLLMRVRPRIYGTRCVRCGVCIESCKSRAIVSCSDGSLVVDDTRCILCMCCVESCQQRAIEVQSPWGRIREVLKR